MIGRDAAHQPGSRLPDVFSTGELARAAGLPVRQIRALLAAGDIRTIDGEFVTPREAARVVRALARGEPAAAGPAAASALAPGDRALFRPHAYTPRPAGLPILFSTSFHAIVIVGVAFVTTVGLTSSEIDEAIVEPEPIRLVYLATPGPGGGGGGGGLRQPAPPPRAERKGSMKLTSPVPARRPPKPIEPVPQPVEPKPEVLKHEPLPPILAPVVTVPADARDRIGSLEDTSADADSRGPGTGGGVGSGEGTGLGEGQGPGIGPGTGGGVGGGPYGPGSGIAPPRLLHEVRPTYTEEARQRSVEGDVLLEIVVRRDGSVGEVRILQRLGSGLDERAVQAVRQWRFAPARRLNTPVDVIVEVAVEFQLR